MVIGPWVSNLPPSYDPPIKFTTRGKINNACDRYVTGGISAEELWDIVDELADKAHIEDVLDT